MDISILYEDNDLAVINKPPGVVVTRSETVRSTTIQDWWLDRIGQHAGDWQTMVPASFAAEYGTPTEIFAERGGIVHRLDKETSGALLLAKNPGALVALLAQFQSRQVQKTYTCLVHGKFSILEDTVRLPLGRSTQNRTKFAVSGDGRVAETHYRVEQFLPHVNLDRIVAAAQQRGSVKQLRKQLERSYQGFSLVACWPKTGRTHQIRVHMAHLKHPIVADQTYLGKKRARLDAAWCPRLFLHASEIQFLHPRSGERMTVTAELWPDLNAVLKFFQ